MDHSLKLPWLLVATPQLTDANFKRAVVLIVETSSQGAMGFVINRPIQTPLADLVNLPNVDVPTNIPAWYGGPVERGTGIILHNQLGDRQASEAEGGSTSFIAYEGLALSSSAQTLSELIDYSIQRSQAVDAQSAGQTSDLAQAIHEDGLYPYRFLVGYAGWGAGQLEEELREGTWIQAPATQELLFHTPWKDLWDAALKTIGANPKTLVPSAQPYLN